MVLKAISRRQPIADYIFPFFPFPFFPSQYFHSRIVGSYSPSQMTLQ